MIKRLIILFILFPSFTFAQFTDDFEDGTISDWTESTAGRWAASDISPLNGSYSLHHIYDNASADHDQVSIALPTLDMNAQNTVWRFKVMHGYNPSSSNNWSVFLTSDTDANQMYPFGSVNGYAIGVNYTGTDDTLRLWKITSGSATEIITTTIDWEENIGVAKVPAIEILRVTDGNWEIRFDPDGNYNNLITIGSGFDDSYLFTDYFGVYYEYSLAQDQKLWIDDIYVGEEIIDTEPPKVDSLKIVSSDELYIKFDEKIDSSTAVNILNYTVDGGIGNPDSVKISDSKNSVDLFFGSEFSNGTDYSLNIQNVKDLEENVMNDTTINFLYFVPQPYDIVINEIMADPYPEVNLPNYEYIEIKNTTEFDINLTGWKLKVGTYERDFPDFTLDSLDYVTLCSTTAGEYLSVYGNVLEFSSFPLIANSGTSIVIYDENKILIDSVNFTDDWYNDPEKEEGGWSLERIDPLNICSTVTNWTASFDSNGGTPGMENSVYASNIDNETPVVEKVEIISSNQLKIIFNEPVTEQTILEKSNYLVSDGVGNPFSVFASTDLREVDLLFLNTFPEKINLTLSIENLSDECGNIISLAEFDFVYYVVLPNDIVINEIMADPEPSMALPEFEYIEIYNTTDFDIGLKDWTLTVGSTIRSLSLETINSGEYLALCSNDAATELQSFGNVLVVSGFPSLANTAQTIILRNAKMEIISTVSYSEDWYQDDYKAEGGWSLEQIDPLNPCGGKNNWIASESETGGTPGQVNSVNASNPDLDVPELLRIAVVDDENIQLFFNETIDSLSAMQTSSYSVDNRVGNPILVDLIGADYKSLILGFENSFEENTIYILEISGGIFDCTGNEIYDKNTAQFSIPAQAEENDLVINEILFNPFVDGYDFVEIYNRSDKTIDLKELLIAGFDDEELDYSSIEIITNEGYLIFPGDYIVLTEDPAVVQEQYITTNPDGFIKIEDLPGYNDDMGRVMLLDQWQNIIDNFGYNDDMHFALLATTEGVSLERINFDRATDDKTNWHSGSELVGFATPAYENSQFLELQDIEDEVKVEPEVFSPDNDGFEDITNVTFTFDEPGYVANIKIFDSRGRLIRYLANNQLLGIDGVISWDGLDDKNQKAPIGIYVVFIEIFNLEGNVKQFKKSVVVAQRF